MSAEEKGRGTRKEITITNDKGRLSKADIERMVNDASKYADDDKAQRDRIEAKNGLEVALSAPRSVGLVGNRFYREFGVWVSR